MVLIHGHAVPAFPLGPVRRWLEQLPGKELSKHLGRHGVEIFGKSPFSFFFGNTCLKQENQESGRICGMSLSLNMERLRNNWDLIIVGFETVACWTCWMRFGLSHGSFVGENPFGQGI